MKFTTDNTIVYSSWEDYQLKLLDRELKELAEEFERIMLLEELAQSYLRKPTDN